MFKTLLKHKILELSINIFFDKLTVNINPHKVGSPIKVKDLVPIPIGRTIYGVQFSSEVNIHHNFIFPQPLEATTFQGRSCVCLAVVNLPISYARKTYLALDDDDILYM